MNRIPVIATEESDEDWARLLPYLQTPEARRALGSNPSRTTIARFMAGGNLNDFFLEFYEYICGFWIQGDGNPPTDFSGLPPVPCTRYEAQKDSDFTLDPSCSENGGCWQRPQAAMCVLAARP